MNHSTPVDYPQPQSGEIPRYSGLPTFFRLPFGAQIASLDIGVVGVRGMVAPPTGREPGTARVNYAMPPAWYGGCIR